MKVPKQGQGNWQPFTAASSGFSMVEILVAICIAAVLATMLTSSLQGATKKAKAAQCLAKMKNLGAGILLYTQDTGEYPRSLHSAAGAGKQSWAKAILPYMGYPSTPSDAEWASIFEKAYRCPADKNKSESIYSYALNVYFELTPDGDDYAGSPATWRKPVNLDHATSTILLAEPKAVYFADHIMCHQWTTAAGSTNAVDSKRHLNKSNYAFADGHVESLTISETFNPAKAINLWNPSLAK